MIVAFKSTEVVPPLVNGDHLSRAEFERRYEAMPDVKKAELIEGVVYMPSPVSWTHHGSQHAVLIWLLGHYRVMTPGTDVADNATVRLDDDNEPQPDVALIVRPELGGQAQFSDKYLGGAPEFVAEVAASSASIDLNAKLRAYRRNGVREYLVWRTEDGEVDWFAWDDGRFERQAADADGVIRSRVFPGLWVDVPALLRDDGPALLETVNRGLASPEHAAFVARLRDEAVRRRPG